MIFSNVRADHRVIKVAGDYNLPPFEYIDEVGNYVGFNVDIMKAIELNSETSVKFIPLRWNEALKSLEDGEVDAIQGMTKTKERMKKYDFSDPILTNEQVMFVRSDENEIKSLKDLKQKRVVIQKKGSMDEYSHLLNGAFVIREDTQKEAIYLLKNGYADVFIGQKLAGLYMIQKYDLQDKIKIVGKPVLTLDYCIAVKKGNKELLKEINSTLRKVRKDGLYNTLYFKWFGENYFDKKLIFIRFIILFAASLSIALITILLLKHNNLKLKRLVEEKTEELTRLNEKLKSSNDNLMFNNDELLRNNSDLTNLNNRLLEEIEQRKRAEEKVKYYGTHDYLTGFYNRKFLLDKIEELINEDRKFALLYLDFDKFKHINDSFGHEAGDIILIETTKRIRNILQKDDVPARIGGDEFIIILTGDYEKDEIMARGKAMLSVLNEPIEFSGKIIIPSLSIGVSSYPENGSNIEELIKKADKLMYEAKADGGNSIKI
ncbi:Cyclic di-GMP phosphodiesterase Gmr [Caloramator mitchellensis]|uniref:Cyclic di-GMP phosphodiesterase Gmr n=2 Tax=Caloramator mitchellensis TaxID=908809 RepID=A0A0R3JV13_CALMK|nr:Cyclic di-GMP phosphodiesterase Gmr [Caloramator mitchellensis]